MVKFLLVYLMWGVICAAVGWASFIGVSMMDKFGVREEYAAISFRLLAVIGGLFVLYFVAKYLFILFAWTLTW